MHLSRSGARPPPTLSMISRIARPIVAFARLPEPKALAPPFIPISRAIGPLTITNGEAMWVVACTPFRLNGQSVRASIAARTTWCVFGLAAGHNHVDGEHFASKSTPARSDFALDETWIAAQRMHDGIDLVLRGRDDRQAVGPTALEVELHQIHIRSFSRQWFEESRREGH